MSMPVGTIRGAYNGKQDYSILTKAQRKMPLEPWEKEWLHNYMNPRQRRTRAGRIKNIDGRATALYQSARKVAGQKGLEFTLPRSFIAERLHIGYCSVTNIDFVLTGGHRHHLAPSVDRKDPAKGYTEENCQVVVYLYQLAKNSFTAEDVLAVSRALVAKAESERKPEPEALTQAVGQ